MSRFPEKAILGCLALLLVSACADNRRDASIAPPESRTKAVLDAQYAAKGPKPPMQSVEADRIYDTYIENIGKKSQEDDSGTE